MNRALDALFDAIEAGNSGAWLDVLGLIAALALAVLWAAW